MDGVYLFRSYCFSGSVLEQLNLLWVLYFVFRKEVALPFHSF
jgi:hypothetical protein